MPTRPSNTRSKTLRAIPLPGHLPAHHRGSGHRGGPAVNRPDSVDEPLTRAQVAAVVVILALILGVIVGLFVFGHGTAAFIVLLALGVAGLAAYMGASR